jgi:DNA-binding CsgD family transcriptional regulator
MGARRPSRQPKRLSEVIELIYEGVLDPSIWPQVLEPVREYVPADSALLRVYGERWGSVLQSMSTGFDPASQEVYREEFVEEDPIVPILDAMPPGKMAVLDDQLPFACLERTRFYQEYLKPQDKRHILGGTLLRVGVCSVMIGFQRAHDASPFTIREQRRAQVFVPHWVRALKLADHLHREQMQTRMTEALLGDAAPAMLLFDANGRVVYLNHSAELLLSRQQQLLVRNQRLHTRSRQLQNWLDAALVVKNRKGLSGAWEGSSARFTSLDQREDIALALLPWSGQVALSYGFTEAVTAGILSSLRPKESFSVPMIGALFGLSPGEARLAGALTRTGSLAQAAAELGIQVSTARDRLKSIFRKTGFDSQVALITAILRSPTRKSTAM